MKQNFSFGHAKIALFPQLLTLEARIPQSVARERKKKGSVFVTRRPIFREIAPIHLDGRFLFLTLID